VSAHEAAPILLLEDDRVTAALIGQLLAAQRITNPALVMRTGSGADADITRAYELGIDAYLVKPAGLHGLPDVIRELRLPHELKRSTSEAPPASDGGGEGA
jgi:DNA-binding response OmpR family regulator